MNFRPWPSILLIALLLAFNYECQALEGIGSRIARAFNSLSIAFRQDEQTFKHPQKEIEPPFPTKPGKLLEQRSLADYCSHRAQGARFQLGECSPAFVVCESNAIRFENCPTGQVFVDSECRLASEQPACFDISSNQLNHATEKLVQATSFCRVHSPPGFIHLASGSNKCSRQALICAAQNRPLTIACPQGFSLQTEDLTCQKTNRDCLFTDKSMVQPVKTALERLFCIQHEDEGEPGTSIPPPFPGQVRTSDLSIANSNGLRCKDWFVSCHHWEKEFVFCGQDSLFDRQNGACRPSRPTDNCPTIFSCRGFEWQIIPFGKCRPEFIYCRGLIPVQFQCRSDFVLMDGKCVLEKTVSEKCEASEEKPEEGEEAECKEDERKPNDANCTRFFQCEHDDGNVLRWRHYECPKGEGYDPHIKDCSTGYQCESECQEGQSFLVSCYEYFQCRDHSFQAGVCPSKSKYLVDAQRCVFDSSCRHRDDKETDETPTDICHENEVIKSRDCISYGICKGSTIHWKPCQQPNGKYHDQCPGCEHGGHNNHPKSQEPDPDSKIPSNPDKDSNFSPIECADRAVVLSKNDCKRFMKCYAGHWFMVECPNDKFYSLETQACTSEKCESAGVYLPPPKTPDHVPDYTPIEKPACTDSSCCTAESPKLAVKTDCQIYKECSVGRYVERQCPFNERFDAKEQKCVKGSHCDSKEKEDKKSYEDEDSNTSCEHGAIKPLRKCGYLRLCVNGNWAAGRCKNGMAFRDGKCSKTLSCKDVKDESKSDEKDDDKWDHEKKHDVCLDGESKRHPYSCNKYLICDHGIFNERICSYGALFNPKNQRCDLNFECDYKNQPKCYEGQRKMIKQNCHAYLRCYEGKFVEETCSNKDVFDDETKMCAKGKCFDENSEGKDDEKSVDSNDSDEKTNKKKHKKYKKKKPKKHSESEEEEKGGGDPDSVPCKESPGAGGFRRDRHKCDRFYQCSNGDWVPKTCPSGTVFNTHIGVCDWPRNVPGCEDG